MIHSEAPRIQDLPSGKICVTVSGAREDAAPAILFMHGLAGSSITLEPMITVSRVERKFKCLKVDFPGHGMTPYTGQGADVHTVVKMMWELLEKFGVGEVMIVGHGFGGLIAIMMASEKPELVPKLFLLAPALPPTTSLRPTLQSDLSLVKTHGLHPICNRLMTFMAPVTRQSRLTCLALIKTQALCTSPTAYVSFLESLLEMKDEPIAYDKIIAKTVIVGGEKDDMFNPFVEGAKAKISGAKSHMVYGTGHWVILEDYESVGEVLAAFV